MTERVREIFLISQLAYTSDNSLKIYGRFYSDSASKWVQLDHWLELDRQLRLDLVWNILLTQETYPLSRVFELISDVILR